MDFVRIMAIFEFFLDSPYQLAIALHFFVNHTCNYVYHCLLQASSAF